MMSNIQKAYFIIIYNKTAQQNIIGKLISIELVESRYLSTYHSHYIFNSL